MLLSSFTSCSLSSYFNLHIFIYSAYSRINTACFVRTLAFNFFKKDYSFIFQERVKPNQTKVQTWSFPLMGSLAYTTLSIAYDNQRWDVTHNELNSQNITPSSNAPKRSTWWHDSSLHWSTWPFCTTGTETVSWEGSSLDLMYTKKAGIILRSVVQKYVI